MVICYCGSPMNEPWLRSPVAFRVPLHPPRLTAKCGAGQGERAADGERLVMVALESFLDVEVEAGQPVVLHRVFLCLVPELPGRPHHDTDDTKIADKRNPDDTYESYESQVTAKLANGGHHAGRDFHAAVRNSLQEECGRAAVLKRRKLPISHIGPQPSSTTDQL
jgi:hypothetical protein